MNQVPVYTVVVLIGVLTAVTFKFFFFSSATTTPNHPRKDSAILITGCSRGIGKTMADELARLGYTVLGAVRSQSSYGALEAEGKQAMIDGGGGGGTILPIHLDVSNDDQISSAVSRVEAILKERNLELIGIVNNAGINPEADIYSKIWNDGKGQVPDNELADMSVAKRVMDTNVLGVLRVTKAFLPLLTKEAKVGRIILLGSYFGSVSGAMNLSHLYYEASKFAMEGFADGLRRSLRKQEIGVTLLKPGNIQTDMNSVGEVSSDVVSQAVLQVLETSYPPPPRMYPGTVKGYSSWFLCTVFSILPTSITDTLV
jgi:NAD(P)-dependent dehydrogenase (short-subunit alcohol dehydrogenase family)